LSSVLDCRASAKDSEIPDRVRDDDGAEGSAFR